MEEITMPDELEATPEEPHPEQPAAEPVDASADGWHTELALESQRYVMKATAPDGSVHICHSQEELDALRALR